MFLVVKIVVVSGRETLDGIGASSPVDCKRHERCAQGRSAKYVH